MNTAAAATLTVAIVLAALAGVLWRISRAHRAYTAARHDVGPDTLRLLQELDAHLDNYVAADDELAAGFDRLRAAVRDEQQKGDPA